VGHCLSSLTCVGLQIWHLFFLAGSLRTPSKRVTQQGMPQINTGIIRCFAACVAEGDEQPPQPPFSPARGVRYLSPRAAASVTMPSEGRPALLSTNAAGSRDGVGERRFISRVLPPLAVQGAQRGRGPQAAVSSVASSTPNWRNPLSAALLPSPASFCGSDQPTPSAPTPSLELTVTGDSTLPPGHMGPSRPPMWHCTSKAPIKSNVSFMLTGEELVRETLLAIMMQWLSTSP
jgi:hypothetical protein